MNAHLNPSSLVLISTISEQKNAKLQDVAAYLDTNTDARILVEGYCDWKGTPAYNKSLGDRRASSVKQYLVDLGADINRIDVLSMGDEFATPNADSTTSALSGKPTLWCLVVPD